MTILLLESIHPDARERLAASGQVLFAEDPDEAISLARNEAVDAIITRGRGQVRRPLIEASPRLRVVARVGVGLDNVDVDAATERGVLVINSPGSTTIAVAEHTMLLMAALVRGLYPSLQAVKAGNWESRRSYRGDDLAGKRLGIVGMGDIGQRVARIAAAYDMEVLYWSRQKKDVPYPYLSLPELLATADIVSLHVALTPETRHLIGRRELEITKPGSMLVNTARGAIIDERALLDALRSGRLAGFAADVLEQEPPATSDPLVACEQSLITPHTAAMTGHTFEVMSLRTAGNVLAALQGHTVEPGCIANEKALRDRTGQVVAGSPARG